MGLHVRHQIMIKILPHKNSFVLCNCATRIERFRIYVSSVTPQDTKHNNHFELRPFFLNPTVINTVNASPSTGCSLHGFKTYCKYFSDHTNKCYSMRTLLNF